MDQKWFEMKDVKRPSTRVWVPLAADQTISQSGRWGHVGYVEEYFGVFSVLFRSDCRDAALNLEQIQVQRVHNQPECGGGEYVPAEVLLSEPEGIYVVLRQHFDTGDLPVWNLHQDFVQALQLLRREDSWVSPYEDYEQVARLRRDSDGRPVLLEARSEYVRDYLCACGYGLLFATYRSRDEIAEGFDKIRWAGQRHSRKFRNGRWEGRISDIHEGSGAPYGVEWAVCRVWLGDVDPDEDVPVYDAPNDENVRSQHYMKGDEGRKIQRARGEMWLNDWLEPAGKSPRVRGDKVEVHIPFKIDVEGNTSIAKELQPSRRYLWFDLGVAKACLESRPHGILHWYTEDTGRLGFVPHQAVHFGMNGIGLITVFAKDIAELSERHQKLWVAHNVSPDGGVCAELLQSQQQCQPAGTSAPEAVIAPMMGRIDEVSCQHWGRPLFNPNADPADSLRHIHRFYAHDLASFCALAKHINVAITERLNSDLLKSLTPKAEPKMRSRKRLETLLSFADPRAKEILAPLAAVYDLRVADAHAGAADLEKALAIAKVDHNGLFVLTAKKMIARVAQCLAFVEWAIPRVKKQVGGFGGRS